MSAPAFAIPPQTPLDAYRPRLRVLTEDDIAGGRLWAEDRRPCACGTDVVVLDHEAVADVITRHNQTVAHHAWRAAREA